MPTDAEILAAVTATVEKQQLWVENVVFEKLGFNWGSQALALKGTYAIVLQQPYAAGRVDYIVQAKALTPEGEDIGFNINSQSEDHFDIWVSDPCVFTYVVFNPKELL
jgi:hypothetical protein